MNKYYITIISVEDFRIRHTEHYECEGTLGECILLSAEEMLESGDLILITSSKDEVLKIDLLKENSEFRIDQTNSIGILDCSTECAEDAFSIEYYGSYETLLVEKINLLNKTLKSYQDRFQSLWRYLAEESKISTIGEILKILCFEYIHDIDIFFVDPTETICIKLLPIPYEKFTEINSVHNLLEVVSSSLLASIDRIINQLESQI